MANEQFPHSMRSEGTDYERANRELGIYPSPSIWGALLNPQHAELIGAIQRGILQRMQATGYTQGLTGYQPGQPTPPQQTGNGGGGLLGGLLGALFGPGAPR